MRDILDALESIHTNKKKTMDIKKEMNKKPAVMKALSLEDTEVLEGTEMGQIGDVHVKQFGMAKGQLGIQLTSDKGEGYVQMSKEDAKAMAERLLQWANSSEPAMPGEYESVEENIGDAYYEPKDEKDEVAHWLTSQMKYISNITPRFDMNTTAGKYTARLIKNAGGSGAEEMEKVKQHLESAQAAIKEYMQNVLSTMGESVEEGYAGGDDVAHIESYLDYIDQLTQKMEDKKVAYEIQNAADDIRKALELDPTNVRTAFESLKARVEEDCSCETELTNSEEQKMETNQKDTVKVAVEDLARVLELAGLGKEIVKAEAQAEAQAENEVELDEYSNSPDEDYFDADTQLNKMSGGLNGPKAQHKKEYPGDNPLAVELEQKLAKLLADM